VQLRIFFKTFPETTKCPSCRRVGTIRRSRARNLFETLVKSSKMAGSYKCRDCGWRGILKKYTINRYSIITMTFYIILILLVAYIISMVLQKNFSS